MLSAHQAALALSLCTFLFSSHVGRSAEISGRSLYQGLSTLAKGQRATRPALPPDYAACANCHGTRGLGAAEGAGVIPSTRWADLASPRGNLPAFANAQAVMLAITKGRGRTGASLSPAMPRYDLDPAEGEALAAYLRVIGSSADVARGVSDSSIRFATLVPLTGPLAHVGKSIHMGIASSFTRINEKGGVFGRKLELVSIDSAGSQNLIEESLREENIYALVGSLWRQNVDLESFLAERHISSIGSITTSDNKRSATRWNFPLLANQTDQTNILASALKQCPPEKQIWTISAGAGPMNKQVGAHLQFSSSHNLIAALTTETRTGCLVLTLGQFQAVGHEVASGWHKIIVLPFPAHFLTSKPDVWYGLGEAAAEMTQELLANAGQSLDEHALLDQLARLDGFSPLPGLIFKGGKNATSAFPPEIINIETLQNAADALPKPY